MHQLGPAGFRQQPLQAGPIPSGQGGLGHPAGQNAAGIRQQRLPAADPQAPFIGLGPLPPGARAGQPRILGQHGQGQPVGQRPHQQAPAQPAQGTGEGGREQGAAAHGLVENVRPFHRTVPRSRLAMASTNTPRKNNTGTGKIRLIQPKLPTRRVISSSCAAKPP